ncbi:MAG: porphobilinogen synthase [Desulfovibrio sp.]|nr:MAG: porphobilinogen synthase [Desulfovibrio sp.]
MLDNIMRGRRLRRTKVLRRMVRETEVRPQDLIQPYFVAETIGDDEAAPISSMPGQSQLGLKALERKVGEAVAKGLTSCILFGIPKHKDELATQAYDSNGIVQRAVAMLKDNYPDLVVVTDVCLCEFTSHGHCGLVDKHSPHDPVRNDTTVELLARTALSHAEAGADIIAPSDMMDGRVGAIRATLDDVGFEHIPIMSYAVKFASAFYGPFREAAESAPKFGDRKSYQMDAGNFREAMREAEADTLEGADMLMVKPAMPNLDILRSMRERFDLPMAAYQVSGEYSMIMAAAKMGWLDAKATMLESLTCIKRAGADLIISYFTEAFLRAQAE